MAPLAVLADLSEGGDGDRGSHRQVHKDGTCWLVFQDLQIDEITPGMTAYITG
jgi:hypothetical protein